MNTDRQKATPESIVPPEVARGSAEARRAWLRERGEAVDYQPEVIDLSHHATEEKPVTAQQQPDGTWAPAQPIAPTRLLRLERWLRRHGLRRLAAVLATWDEKGLAR